MADITTEKGKITSVWTRTNENGEDKNDFRINHSLVQGKTLGIGVSAKNYSAIVAMCLTAFSSNRDVTVRYEGLLLKDVRLFMS